MTPAERALLLAVAKHLSETLCEKGDPAGYALIMDIAAVEEEAATEAPAGADVCPVCADTETVVGDMKLVPCPYCTGKKEKK